MTLLRDFLGGLKTAENGDVVFKKYSKEFAPLSCRTSSLLLGMLGRRDKRIVAALLNLVSSSVLGPEVTVHCERRGTDDSRFTFKVS